MSSARKPPTKYTAILSSNCLGEVFPPLDPLEITCAEVEPYGAITLTRFRSLEEAVQLELSSAEVDALIALNSRRKRLIARWQEERSGPLAELNEVPF